MKRLNFLHEVFIAFLFLIAIMLPIPKVNGQQIIIVKKDKADDIARKPPMGWNSWDCFGPTVTEEEVKANADYMAEKLMNYGWRYIVVDIRWYVDNDKAHGYNETDPVFVMDEYGRFQPSEVRFPSAADGKGFKEIADYVHGKGLKFGIHVMRGIPVEAVKKNTPIKGSKAHAADIYSTELQCEWLHDMYTVVAGRKGSQEYYNSIFDLYASWGVDFVKVDDLSKPYHLDEIEMIRKAINQCGRTMVFSTSPGETPLERAGHVMEHANMWRISNDFWDNWDALKKQFERCSKWAPSAGPGHWPDADMLPLGRIGIRAEQGDPRITNFTKDEQFTLMTLWAIFRSPLMFGGNLPDNDEFTLALITNREVLAVNQNSKNNRQLKNDGGIITWTADNPGSGGKFVAVFNTTDEGNREIGISLGEIGMKKECLIRNLWTKTDVGKFKDFFSCRVPEHGAALFRISKGK